MKMKKIATLLLTAMISATAALSAFAATYSLNGISITPPARFTSVESSVDDLDCSRDGGNFDEDLDYEAAYLSGKLKKKAKQGMKEYRQDDYTIVRRVKQIVAADGRVGYYFIVADFDDDCEYTLAVYAPVKNSSMYVIATDVISFDYMNGKCPFGAAEALELVNSVGTSSGAAVGTTTTTTVPTTPTYPTTTYPTTVPATTYVPSVPSYVPGYNAAG